MNRLFDLIARIYDRVIGPYETERLAGLLELDQTLVLLDAGGGTGRVSGELRPLCRNVVVSDLSLPMLRQTRLKEGLLPVAVRAEGLPFADGAFPRIAVVDALHHFRDQETALTDLVRVLAPGGIMVVEEPDIHKVSVKLVALAEKLALMRSRFLTGERIAVFLTDLGLEVRIERAGHVVWITGRKHA